MGITDVILKWVISMENVCISKTKQKTKQSKTNKQNKQTKRNIHTCKFVPQNQSTTRQHWFREWLAYLANQWRPQFTDANLRHCHQICDE